jgi:hypothetical protein
LQFTAFVADCRVEVLTDLHAAAPRPSITMAEAYDLV